MLAARARASLCLAHSGKNIHGELIEPLVRQTLAQHRVFIEVVSQERLHAWLRKPGGVRYMLSVARKFVKDGANFFVFVPALGFLLEDEISAHATCGEILYALAIFRTVGVCIEVARAVVADVFEEFHEPERGFEARGTEAQILIVAPGVLIVQIDVKEFARFPGLGDSVKEIEAGHLFMSHFGVDADHLGMIERGDEAEVMAGGGHVNVTARLVGFGLQGEAITVAAVEIVFAQIIYCFAEPFDGFVRPAAGIGFDAFASTPEDKNLRAQFRAEIHGAQSFLQRVSADFRIVCGEGAVAKDGMEEKGNGGHGNDDTVSGTSLFKLRNDAVALGPGGIDRNQIVVVQIDAPGSHFRKQADNVDRRKGGAHKISERIAAAVADGPKSEGKLVFGLRLKGMVAAHERLSSAGSIQVGRTKKAGCVLESRGWQWRSSPQRTTVYVNGRDIVSCVRRIATIN